MDSLNPGQRAAVEHITGPCCVVAGAGSGKCLTGDTLIFTSKGIIPIDEIPKYFEVKENDCLASVVSYDTTGVRHITETSHWFNMGYSDTVKLITKSGYQICGTPEHPILVLTEKGDLEFKQLGLLQGNEIIVISINNDIWGDYSLEPELGYLMGLLTGDGCLTHQGGTIGFARCGPYLPPEFKRIVKKYFGKESKSYPRKPNSNSITSYVHSIAMKKELERLGLKMVYAQDKDIPWSVLCSPRETVIAYLQGLFDTDGSINSATIEMTTASKKLAQQVQVCLLNLGIRTSLKLKTAVNYPDRQYWRLAIMGESLHLFGKIVGFKNELTKKAKLVERLQIASNSNIEVIYNQTSRFKSLREELKAVSCWNGRNQSIYNGQEIISFKDYLLGKRNPSRKQLKKALANVANSQNIDVVYLKNITDNFFFDFIESIEDGGKQLVFDFTVPKTHSFVSNGLISHNTKVLTSRIANLVEEGVDPSNILAVTFTKKAAGEMKERLVSLIGDDACRVNMGTFHSICYRILRREWQRGEQREPVQEYWQKKTIRDILAVPSRNNPQGMNWNLDIGQAMSFISWQKNNLIGPDGPFDDIAANEDKYRILYRAYEEAKDREKKLDFDDMLLWCYQLLKNNAGVRARYSTEFRYILVDEFQDTNKAQYEILKLLARPLNNVFVVGDARQAIYGWRAARVDFILKFEKEWPGARTVVLETNYRSTENIVEISNRLIGGAGIDYPGKCHANQGSRLDPIMLDSDDEDHEAAQVVAEIQTLTNAGDCKLSDCAILYRVNAHSRALEDALIAAQIPYVIFGATGFYQRKEVKDILAYLRILEDPNNDEAISRVINIPKRYLGKVFVQRAQEYARQQGVSLLDALRHCPEARQFKYRGVRDFLHCIDVLMREKEDFIPVTIVKRVREVTGYDAWLCEEEGADEGADNQRLDNLDALAAAAERFGRLSDFIFYCEQAGSRKKDEAGTNKVQLMTLHRSKGLEFPVVFLAGMIQGLLPHRRSCMYADGELVPESVEEERRLCYVGMTRAKERLYLSTMSTYRDKYAEPSMFLREVQPVEDLEPGEGEVSAA